MVHGTDATFFASVADLRAWFAAQHADATEIVIGFHKKGTGTAGVTYAEALDEALCVGWIDGVRRRIDDRAYVIRFTPRKTRSIWSAVNIARAGELTAAGRMQPAGTAAFEGRDRAREKQYAFEQESTALDAASEAEFRAHADAWAFFTAQAPYYQRTAQWWVISAKRAETRRTRLATLIADSAAGRRLAHLMRWQKS